MYEDNNAHTFIFLWGLRKVPHIWTLSSSTFNIFATNAMKNKIIVFMTPLTIYLSTVQREKIQW